MFLSGFLSDVSTFDKIIVISILGAIIFGALKNKNGGGRRGGGKSGGET